MKIARNEIFIGAELAGAVGAHAPPLLRPSLKFIV